MSILDIAAIISINSHGKIYEWNKGAERIFGYSNEEMQNNSLEKTIVPQRYRKAHHEGIDQFVKNKKGQHIINQLIEITALKKNGEEFLISMCLVKNGIGGITAMIKDLSDKKKVNKIIDEYNLFKDLANSIVDPITVVDNEGKYLICNEAFLKEVYLDIYTFNLNKIDGDFFDDVSCIKLKKLDYEIITNKKEFYSTNLFFNNKNWLVSANSYKGQGVVKMFKNITSQIDLEEELENLKQNTLDIVESKEKFIITMSHDIKTPINAIISAIDLLNGESLDPDTLEILEILQNSSKYLSLLVNNIMDYSKIEANKIEYSPENCNLRDTINDQITILKPMIKEKNAKINVIIDPIVPEIIYTDKTKFKQIFINLVGNSVKFIEDNDGQVDIDIKISENNMLQITIKDNGIGIQKELITHLFKPFNQTNKENSLHGTGLGLYICKKLVNILNGTIGVYSEINKGSSFWFKIPIDKESKYINQKLPENIYDCHILIADDYEISRKILFEQLKVLNVKNITLTENGEKVLAFNNLLPFDVFILDYYMPRINGLETAKKIRMKEKELNRMYPSIIIIESAEPFDDIHTETNDVINDILIKPFNIETLKKTIQKHLNIAYKTTKQTIVN